ncbi:tetratricopeptide repeat protein [Phenylobacterium sp.]|uniref:tetratricopeptide repeat protein n=1 Tax=Phenylobacterium sp. TaxID=1871053 RepID=UPI003568F663
MQDDVSQDQFARGVELQRAQRYAEAAEVYRQIAPARLTSNLACNLGVCLGELGDWTGAAHYLGLAARHQPANADFRRRLAAVCAEAGRTDLAEQEYQAARAAKPDDRSAELALAGLYLSLGRYAEGWPLMAARVPLHPEVVPPVQVRFPEWRGEPLEGKSVLVWVEQGFGDQIQMCRFADSLKARGAARVTLGCRPALAHLFSTLAGADAIIPIATGASAAVAPHDYWSRYFSLPEPLGVTLETLPSAPYLAAPADRRERWSDARGIGLAWQASPTGFNAPNKGLPTELAQRLLDRGATSLHPEDTGARDFADTAAIIERLDLVISIDTSVAHLAGAMGKPCWTLIPYIHADWRWLRERTDSPWYPTLKLYRQTKPRDWSETIDQVLRDL